MAIPIGTESPTIDVVANQRQIAALDQASQSILQNTRTLIGSADASFTLGARASRPSSGAAGDRYFANDIGARGGFVYVWNGTTWEIMVGWASGTDAERSAYTPDSTDSGAFFLATDTSKIWEVVGSTWTDRSTTVTSGLLTSTSFNLNNGAKQTLFTVPGGRSAIVTHVVARSASIDLSGGSTGNINFGFDGGATDWSTSAPLIITHITSATEFMVFGQEFATANRESVTGTAGQTFGGIVDLPFGAVATCVIEVWGNTF